MAYNTPTPVPSTPTPTLPPATPTLPPDTPTPEPTPTPYQIPSDDIIYTAAHIISKEVGVGPYFRGPESKVREASRLVAWTMRNRVEVGETVHGPYGSRQLTVTYEEAFLAYQAYWAMDDIPDPIVYQEVRQVLTAPNNNGDPLGGAIFTINHQCYLDLGRPQEGYVTKVLWKPEQGDEPDEDKPTLGKYFYTIYHLDFGQIMNQLST